MLCSPAIGRITDSTGSLPAMATPEAHAGAVARGIIVGLFSACLRLGLVDQFVIGRLGVV